MTEYRYLLLCRHARHRDGKLVAVEDDDDKVWRFPTESVAGRLLEEVAFGDDGLRPAKVLYAPTPEAIGTAAVLLERLRGESADAEAKPATPQQDNSQADKKPSQPELPATPVTIQRPSWLSKDEWDARLGKPYKGEIEPQKVYELLPSRLRKLEGAKKEIEKAINGLDAGNAILVVGHQPQLGCLSPLFLQRKFGFIRRAVPIDSSEIVCLRLKKKGEGTDAEWRGRLVWTLAADDRDALRQVADKVKGKMESAKLLSAVIGLVLTALLGVLLDVDRWNALGSKVNPVQASLPGWTYNGQTAARIAFAMLLAAGALYMLTMYAYDRLLMPTRFWVEGRGERAFQAVASSEQESETAAPSGQESETAAPSGRRSSKDLSWSWLWRVRRRWLPRRPPSSSAWVVYRNMQRIWFCLFTPANVLVALGLTVLASALLRVQKDDWIPATVALVIVTGWGWWFRPILGSED